ncbi:hypothetical protein ACFQMA_17495 [Halosimplex aquaticum]|uniref:Lipoprotein n=1 Tax=Halosimplex aquaticum TaxID=3026162 RepID=A0ABD5Y7B7_9EURY|nr:hypothetical protein [Halosimplex aquaticum]
MPPFTRRRALQAAVGLAAGFAGCNDSSGGGRSPTPSAPRGPDDDHVALDPEYVTLRASDYELGDRFAWFLADPADRPTDGGTVDRSDRQTRGLIADRATAETLTIEEGGVADTEISDSPEAVREFVAATDFDRETLYLHHELTDECYRLVLCHVSWADREVEIRYGRFLRDHDVACEADARDGHLTVVRIPAALDPKRYELGGTGVGNGHCFPPPGERGRPTPPVTAPGTTADTDAEAGTPADAASRDGRTR